MAATTIIFGLLMSALGVGGYVMSGTSSVTALIPALFGLPLIILGFLARDEHMRKHTMHAASMVGLIGVLAAIGSLATTPMDLRPALAVYSQIAMALLMGIFLALCIRSFIAARKARAAKG
jgi:hypothetical protein